jgi:hypothetical protein
MTTTIRKATAVQLVQDPSTVNVRKASAVAFVSDAGMQLRQITGYAFETPAPGMQLRQIVGYAFETPKPGMPLSKTGDLALYDLINGNRVVSTLFSASNTTLGTPTALGSPDANGHNTSVSLTAKAGSGYSGSTTFYYLRRPLTDAIAVGQSISLGTIASATTVWAMLATINTKYGLNLVQQDVVNNPVPAGATAIVLTVAPGSYLFVPGSQSVVGIQTQLSSAVAQPYLKGFDNASGVGPTNTRLLLHLDGNTTDVLGHTVNNVGNNAWAVSGTNPVKFGSGAIGIGATTSCLQVVDSGDLMFLKDFTIEAWVYLASHGGYLFAKNTGADGTSASYPSNGYLYFDSAAGKVNVKPDTATTVQVVGSYGAIANTWAHVALTKSGTTWTVWINGVSIGTFQSALSFGNFNTFWTIGNMNNASTPIAANIDEVRFSNICRYFSSFTPPTAAFTLD